MIQNLRVIKVDENIRKEVYKMGFHQWKNTLTWQEYCRENEEEDRVGFRLALINITKIVATIYIRIFAPIKGINVIGLGSLITLPKERRKGYAEILMKETIHLYKNDFSNFIFIGYSDIHPNYYVRKFGFRILPIHLQKYKYKPCIIICSNEQWKKIIANWKIDDLPDYF